MSIDNFKSLLDGIDPAALLPEMDSVMGVLALAMRLAVMVGPLVLLVLGVAYLIAAPKEANYYFGYRCFFGMGSVEAWRYSQRIAGLVWGALGLVLTVVMLFVSAGFAGQPTNEMIASALTCILWEAGLAVVSVLAINTVVALNFDSKGELRKKKTRT